MFGRHGRLGPRRRVDVGRAGNRRPPRPVLRLVVDEETAPPQFVDGIRLCDLEYPIGDVVILGLRMSPVPERILEDASHRSVVQYPPPEQ